MDLALGQLRAEGKVLRDEDIELLFLLVHEHINLPGHYYFGLAEALQRGEPRDLRNPRDAIQELGYALHSQLPHILWLADPPTAHVLDHL